MIVLDASALLAMILEEPGADKVADRLDDVVMSTVNYAEVAGYFLRAGATREAVAEKLGAVLPRLMDAGTNDALDAAALLPLTRDAGLSLGDRFCLALARREGCTALTADRAWTRVDLDGVQIELIR